MKIKIRYAGLNDAHYIADLSAQLGYQSSLDDITFRLRQIFSLSDHAVFVAVNEDNRVIGWIHVFSSPRIGSDSFCEIGGLIVDKSLRRHGVAEQLVEKAQIWASKKKSCGLRVRSRTERSEAKLFYKDIGFTILKDQSVFIKNF